MKFQQVSTITLDILSLSPLRTFNLSRMQHGEAEDRGKARSTPEGQYADA